MIVTKQFVFIHVHKTGGQSLIDIIQRCIPEHRVIGYHFPRSDIPQESAKLPIVGMVRNPWDWYVSWYAFNKRPRIHNQLFEVVSKRGEADFKSTITNLVQLGSDQPESAQHREELVRLLPETLDGNRGVGLTRDSVRELSATDTGYYSWLCGRMLGHATDAQTFIGRFEELQDDFIEIMERLGVEEAPLLRHELESCERRNFSQHSHYSHYYDDELRDLIARKEITLIDRFAYRFESMKPPGVSYEFPDDLYAGSTEGFSKLLGRGDNFLQLHSNIDVTAIRQKIDTIPAASWCESEREKLFAVHRDTRALQLVHFEDYQYKRPDYLSHFAEFKEVLKPVLDYIAGYYQDNGFIVRMILAKLVAGGKIPKHADAGYSLLNCHRVHLPIISNDEVVFSVGGEEMTMQVGELWEINNGNVHAVDNHGKEDRIHLIVDWMPNFAGKTEEEALTADQLEGAESATANSAMLNRLVERGHNLHRSGDVKNAESLYRQVLNFDNAHVIANNLLGLLCLQSRRFDEAASHIEKALDIAPNDAQAHANLGLCYQGLNRPELSVRHFQESLRLQPNNPKACNNLGSLYVSLGWVRESIPYFQRALAIQPDLPEVLFNLGSALLQLQQFDEATASLQRCVELRPDFSAGKARLEQAQQGLNRDRQRSMT